MKKTLINVSMVMVALLGAGSPAKADLVTDWNERALNAIRVDRTSPPAASRRLAILHTAMFDAVNGTTMRHRPYLVGRRAPRVASMSAAAATAAHTVMTNQFPMQAATFTAAYTADLAAIRDGVSKRRGIEWGQYVAQQILAARANDGSATAGTTPYTPGTNPGDWRPTVSFGGVVRPALLPGWGSVRPFGINSGSQFRPPAPPALTSSQYAAELEQVRELGATNSLTRTADETEVALFWANGAGTATPPGHWNQIAQIIVARTRATLEQNARLFALLNVALADAAIVSWDAKYVYNLWRPITAIQLADTDGNDDTDADPTWEPLLFTPPFPEYTSGHSTFSAAAAVVLARYFGTDNIPFVATSDDAPGVERIFTSFSDAAFESGMSRIYGGIHFMTGNIYGLQSGGMIGDHVMDNIMLQRRGHARPAVWF